MAFFVGISAAQAKDSEGRDGEPNKASALFSQLSNAYVLPGVYVSHNLREGYRKFDDADKYQHVGNTNPFIFGLSVGKRISIDNPRLRFQAMLEFGSGSVKDGDDEVLLTNGLSVGISWHSIYWTGGFLADAHLLFPQNDRTYFVSAGLGAHLTYFDTMVKLLGTGEEIKGGSNGLRGALSPSLNLGCGLEYKRSSWRATCISYNMRFWRSASYREHGALFPMGVDYTEFFFSQSIQLQLLLPRYNRE